MLLGTWAAAAGTTVINTVGLHQTLQCTLDATVTNIQVKVMGEGIVLDLDSNAIINSISDFGKIQSPTALTAAMYILPLADGFIKGKNVQILITKSAAGVVGNVYGVSQRYGTQYFQIVTGTVLANSGQNIEKFLAMWVASPGATDKFNLTFADGFVHQADLPEIIGDGTFSQVQNNQTNLLISNIDFKYKNVNLIPVANRSIYIGRFVKDTSGMDLASQSAPKSGMSKAFGG